MIRTHYLSLPLSEDDIAMLKPGDKVLLSGTIYTARDKAHQRLVQLLETGQNLPFDLATSGICYCGPTPVPPGKVCGAIGPTTSQRMDKYTPKLIEAGLKVMIGKGERDSEVSHFIQAHHALYLVSIGGAAALLSLQVKSCEVFCWEELGTEAIYKLDLDSFPTYVKVV